MIGRLSILITLLVAIGTTHPSFADGPDAFEYSCGAHLHGGHAHVTASASEGDGAYAEAEVQVQWLQYDDESDFDSDSGDYEASATAQVDNDSRLSESVESTWFGISGEISDGDGCEFNLIPPLPPLPGWAEDQLLALECLWENGASDYDYRGKIALDDQEERLYLDQPNDYALDLTANPIFTADSVQTSLPDTADAVDINVSVRGDSGCQFTMKGK